MGMDIQELCSPPPLWVGRGVGGIVVVSSRDGYGYTGAMFPARPVVWWGCGTAYIKNIYNNIYAYIYM